MNRRTINSTMLQTNFLKVWDVQLLVQQINGHANMYIITYFYHISIYIFGMLVHIRSTTNKHNVDTAFSASGIALSACYQILDRHNSDIIFNELIALDTKQTRRSPRCRFVKATILKLTWTLQWKRNTGMYMNKDVYENMFSPPS